MPPRLILNADDFGLTRGINRAVRELYLEGALTSATLMANGPALEDAAAIARAYPSLGVGCHVVLIDGLPVSRPKNIPTLIGKDGKSFRSSLPQFLLAVLRGKVSGDDIAREALAQIERLQRAGIHVTHIDTHKHTHILPGVARPLLDAAERASIRAIRNPFEQPWSLALTHGDLVRHLQVSLMRLLQPKFEALPQIRNSTVLTTNGTLGISATGRLDQTTLRSLLAALPEGTWELVCHPGYNDRDLDTISTSLRGTREVEREALLTAFSPASTHPLHAELIHYGDLGTSCTGHETTR